MGFQEKVLFYNRIGAAIRRLEDLEEAIKHPKVKTIFLLGGDINVLPAVSNKINKEGKNLLVHIDLIEGIGKDWAGVRLLKRMGAAGIVTTKSNLVKSAHEEGISVIQRIFLVDSTSLKTGIRIAKNVQPSAVEILPATVPAYVVNEIKQALGIPILGGGLLKTAEDVKEAFAMGIDFISTSRRALWNL
ncbi:glycerol-3-phosphate responsive antiterminator [Desulforamulus reducens MI-1]|uniref:Glycerol-3-phosphate responsive antiterminator n=1 Tax=Desulforamulus reducens (strain ATCC BAA-1160 / DSM 100696 / MI-1) TaxID=349161 RepID=A4J8E8_DESRM|nr:glycerol-3-phosphate responsive antiterminator [Desulforamulus reducens]ABO51351.1 glycerol-3-phosphate responsive antiterminator [Desulforamulus reducens MI-1]